MSDDETAVKFCKKKIAEIKSSSLFLPLAALSHFHVGVKSVPHCEQTKGMGWDGVSVSRFRIRDTHSSRPHK